MSYAVSTSASTRRVLAIVIVAIAFFLLDVWLVETHHIAGLDQAVLEWFRNPDDLADAWGPAWFEEAAGEITTLGSYTFILLLSLVVVGFLALYQRILAAVFIVLAISGGSLVSTVFKMLFERPRPDVVEHMDRTFTYSFPSGHALISAMAYLTLAAVAARFVDRPWARRYLMACAVALAFLVGTSRVYLGVHWPSDVFAGWCLGTAWAGICWLAADYLSRRTGRADRETDLGTSRI
ncbi:phosphatase PAP2 family protein [Roseibium aestuarii]|uniref:Phosphatase PAP2 family protein n=1 Tax=Roseibium aestuarii TaxID=2600299 RepID=A0ABW4K354_9HYPH|nr:phosphatase PAP2 family protein [Roseibium aestuarii]